MFIFTIKTFTRCLISTNHAFRHLPSTGFLLPVGGPLGLSLLLLLLGGLASVLLLLGLLRGLASASFFFSLLDLGGILLIRGFI